MIPATLIGDIVTEGGPRPGGDLPARFWKRILYKRIGLYGELAGVSVTPAMLVLVVATTYAHVDARLADIPCFLLGQEDTVAGHDGGEEDHFTRAAAPPAFRIRLHADVAPQKPHKG